MHSTDFAKLVRSEYRVLESEFDVPPVKKIRVGKAPNRPEHSRNRLSGEYEKGSDSINIYQVYEATIRDALEILYHEFAHHVHYHVGGDGDPLESVHDDVVDRYRSKGEDMDFDNPRWREDVSYAFAKSWVDTRWTNVKSEWDLGDDESVHLTRYVTTIQP